MANVLETIATLAGAGFTKAEIVELLKQNQPEAKPEPQAKPEAKPQPKPEPQPDPQPKTQEKSEIEKLFESLGMKIDTLTGAIQKQNIQGMSYGSAHEETTDDILAHIINPTTGKEA